jgi:hypothetical protein
LRASVSAENSHLFQAALAGLHSCGSDVLQAVLDAFQVQSSAAADSAAAADAVVLDSVVSTDNTATSITNHPPPQFSSIILQAMSPPLPLPLPLSPAPPPPIDAIKYPFSVSAEQAAVMLHDVAAAAAASKATALSGDEHQVQRWQRHSLIPRHTSHVTRHTSLLTPHT